MVLAKASSLDRQGVTRPLPCHPGETSVVRGYRALCPLCASYWDLESCEQSVAYRDGYPSRHLHYDQRIGQLKVATLERWFASLGLDPRVHVICEIGFGGGFCLAALQRQARQIFGVEAVPADLAHAADLGVPAANLFLFDQRPTRLPGSVSLWLFQDSFEHVLDLDSFMPWVMANSSDEALALVVSPDGTSWSRRLMRRYWPHKLPEHLFHWSPAGLMALWGRFGFEKKRRFPTTKRLSTDQLANHLLLTSSLQWAGSLVKTIVPRLECSFNIGEMGLLFQRLATRGQ